MCRPSGRCWRLRMLPRASGTAGCVNSWQTIDASEEGAVVRLAVDIGGTFTDVTAFDEASGGVLLGKALSTPTNLVEGILAALAHTNVEPANAESIVHGSTVVINALLERK